jgi:hypothetical protein
MNKRCVEASKDGLRGVHTKKFLLCIVVAV